MANEMFTQKSGRQIPVEPVTIPADIMTTVYSLWERLQPTKGYSKNMITLQALLLGCKAWNRRIDYAEKARDAHEEKERKDRIKAQVRLDLADGKRIDPRTILAQLGINVPETAAKSDDVEPVELDGDVDDLTDEQLEQATSPNGAV